MPKGKSTTTQNTIAEPWKAAQPLLQRGLTEAERLYDAGQLTPDPYTGPRVAGQSALTQQGLSMLGGLGANNPITGAATGAYTDMLSADPYRDLDLVKQSALADILPAARSAFSNAGMLNSSIAGDAISGAAARAIAPIEYGAFENQQNRRLSLLGMAPQMQGLGYQDAAAQIGAGQQQDAYNQSLIDADMARYYETENRPYDDLQRLSGLAMGYGGLGGTQSGTTTQGRSSGAAGIAGAGLQLLPFLFGLSERRFKRDVIRISAKAYAFRYLWDDVWHIGPMADEAPAEFKITVNGHEMVDYARALQ